MFDASTHKYTYIYVDNKWHTYIHTLLKTIEVEIYVGLKPTVHYLQSTKVSYKNIIYANIIQWYFFEVELT